MRDATHDDLPRMVEWGHEFFKVSGLVGPFDPTIFARTLKMLIEHEDGILLVSEKGMAAAMVYPSFYSDHLTGQEMFWWGDYRLMKGLEDRARELGAKSFTVASLERLKPGSVERVYLRKGYRPIEHMYVREF